MAAVVALITATVLNPLAGNQPAADAAVRTLLAAASRAAVQPTGSLPRHGYLYSRTGFNYLVVTRIGGHIQPFFDFADRETWVAADGSGRFFEQGYGQPLERKAGWPPLWPQRSRLWRLIRTGWELTPGIVMRTYRRGALDLFHVDGLSIPALAQESDRTDLLTRRILAATGGGSLRRVRAFLIVADLLHQPASPPRLRAALFRVVAKLGPIGVDNPRIYDGQRAMVVDVHEGGVRYVLVFSLKTTALIGEVEYVDSVRITPDLTLTDQLVAGVRYGPVRVVSSMSQRSGPPFCGLLYGRSFTPTGEFTCG